MIILMNPLAAGGRAYKKWKRIEQECLENRNGTRIHMLNGRATTEQIVNEVLENGETDFVAAGGDGTLNTVLNTLLTMTNHGHHQKIRLGAIGLGSSNDFHKPFCNEQTIQGISCKLDFGKAQLRDVGSISFEENGQTITKYFLINASCGITAEGNRFFNNPDGILSRLKRFHTPSAILYAAIRTILLFNNFEVKIHSKETGDFIASLTILGVLKSPYFSGDLHYDTMVSPDSGTFSVNMCSEMNRSQRIRLFMALRQGKFKGLQQTQSWSTSSLSIVSEKPFAVEFDGEIVTTHSAQFSIQPQHIRVCP